MDALIADVVGAVAVVVFLSWLLGAAARRLGQPAVVGQMIAGIALGPSVLGHLPGDLTGRLFPPTALPSLTALAQVAVVLFMFVVGYELDRGLLRHGRRAAVLVAVAALVVPMALGAGAATLFEPAFTALGQPPTNGAFVAFMGVAVSITALPVLAAILRERGLTVTIPGVTSTTAAGIMDGVAWVLLAAVVAGVTRLHGYSWSASLLLFALFMAVMLLLVRPALAWWLNRHPGRTLALPIAMTLALAAAWVTASIGLHAVFGGFVAGLAMPRRTAEPDPDVLEPMEKISGALLPLFFMITGLSVNIGALGGDAFLVLGLVCLIAVAGKTVPAYFAARAGGLRPRDSGIVAVLINTRGLTELIALNVGLSAGLIGQQLFSVLVLMAVLTTVLTSPLLTLVGVPKLAATRTAPPPDLPAVAAARTP
ncbi:cation:proton antiporter [Actinoplanes sp. NPDC023714]|uniref:cation:proton antiporter n=1 Tax=Actinoplanes sp. NPDC023714 TaxID=3154322 RepID=UPI0033CEC753